MSTTSPRLTPPDMDDAFSLDMGDDCHLHTFREGRYIGINLGNTHRMSITIGDLRKLADAADAALANALKPKPKPTHFISTIEHLFGEQRLCVREYGNASPAVLTSVAYRNTPEDRASYHAWISSSHPTWVLAPLAHMEA